MKKLVLLFTGFVFFSGVAIAQHGGEEMTMEKGEVESAEQRQFPGGTSNLVGNQSYKDASAKGEAVMNAPYKSYELQYSLGGMRYPTYRLHRGQKSLKLVSGNPKKFAARFKPEHFPESWAGFYETGYDRSSGWIYFDIKLSTRPSVHADDAKEVVVPDKDREEVALPEEFGFIVPGKVYPPPPTNPSNVLPPPELIQPAPGPPPSFGPELPPRVLPAGLINRSGGGAESRLSRIEQRLNKIENQLKLINDKMFPEVDTSRGYMTEKKINYKGKSYNKGANLSLDVVSSLIKTKYKYSVSCGGNPMLWGNACRHPENYGCGFSSSPPAGVMGGYKTYYLSKKPDDNL